MKGTLLDKSDKEGDNISMSRGPPKTAIKLGRITSSEKQYKSFTTTRKTCNWDCKEYIEYTRVTTDVLYISKIKYIYRYLLLTIPLGNS